MSVLELAPVAQRRPGWAHEEGAWRVVASVGEAPPCSPSAGETACRWTTLSLRHSPPGQPPTITAIAHGGQVELRVIDTGSGIPKDQWEHVFLPFQRLGDRDNTTGLGLALSRGLAEAMGGSITPETTPGGGLTMVLRLPASAQTTSEGPPE